MELAMNREAVCVCVRALCSSYFCMEATLGHWSDIMPLIAVETNVHESTTIIIQGRRQRTKMLEVDELKVGY